MIKNNLYSFLDLIREKPQFYIGDQKLSTLYNNINGYRMYCLHNNIEENLNPNWNEFHDFVAKKLNYSESTSGYKNMILENNAHDEYKSLQNFYELIDNFRKNKTTTACG